MRYIVTIITFLFSLILINGFSQNDYYWVGGQGQWSDINHWATSSGGGVIHSEVPTSQDNVYFDENSFNTETDTVFVNAGNAVCQDMIWDGFDEDSVVLHGLDTLNLRIFGSFKFSAKMLNLFQGTISFESNASGRTVESSGQIFNNHVYFNGEGGEWTIVDSLHVFHPDDIYAATIYHNRGDLITDGNKIFAEGYSSNTYHDRTIDITDSEVLIDGSMEIVGQNLTLNADNSQLFIKTTLTNLDGNYLKYNDVTFYDVGALASSNVVSAFNLVNFLDDATVVGTNTIDTLEVMGVAELDGTDTINHAHLYNPALMAGEQHIINTIMFESYGRLQGYNHQVDSIVVAGPGSISGTSNINSVIFNMVGLVDSMNYIRHAIFASDGEFYGQNTFDTLTFSPGGFYLFEHDSTQIINHAWNIDGTCENMITIQSDVNTVHSTINLMNGTANGDYLVIRDIKAQGPGINFTADNSIDLGNNENWDFNELVSRDLYWVGNAGDWDDNNHWSLSSGGPGGECPPTAIDDVFFDGGSFSDSGQEVSVNIKNAYCRDMDWTGAAGSPIISGADTNNLRIFGSLTFIENMSNEFAGDVYYEATDTGKTVTSAGQPFNRNSVFQGRLGGWLLTDYYTNTDTVFLNHGSLTVTDSLITNMFRSEDTTTRHLSIVGDTIRLFQEYVDVWYLNGANLTLEAEDSRILVMGQYANVNSFSGFPKMKYHKVHFEKNNCILMSNGGFFEYDRVTFESGAPIGEVQGNCRIDSLIFGGGFSRVLDSDSINALLCYGVWDTVAGGGHYIKSAKFFRDGFVYGLNTIDTLRFYNNGIMTMINNVGEGTFYGNGEIYGRNTFGTLEFSPGRAYYLEYDSTLTILNEFNASGDCIDGNIFLHSTEDGKQAIIQKDGGVQLEYLTLRDIKAQGNDLPFIANSSIDLGNNTDWEINNPVPEDFYWVEGDGNWSDLNHWSYISGGPGGQVDCLPSPFDNVFFDENSFSDSAQIVTVNVGDAVCNNMDWTGSEIHYPEFFGVDTNNLRIYGSLTFNEGLTNQFNGPVFFEARQAGNTIASKGVQFNRDVFFQGDGGEWELLDDFSSTAGLPDFGNVLFRKGSIKTNGNTFSCRVFYSDFNSDRQLDISNSTINVTNPYLTEAWFVDFTNLEFTGENSTLIAHVGNVRNLNSDDIVQFHNIQTKGGQAGIYHNNLKASYHKVIMEGLSNVIRGEYWADTIRAIGENCTVKDTAHAQVAIFEKRGYLDGMNIIDSVIFKNEGILLFSNTIRDAVFRHNGQIYGTNYFDTLTFTAGFTYQFQRSLIQTVSKQWNLLGNGCFPITIISSSPGKQATIMTPDSVTVQANHIEVRDIEVSGGTFYAGNFSEDLGNNEGWIFDNGPGQIDKYLPEIRICNNDTLDFKFPFDFQQPVDFNWVDLITMDTISQNDNIMISETGNIAVTITFGNGCVISDTTTITELSPLDLDLGPDQLICEGEQVSFTGVGDFDEYLWSNGVTQPVYVAQQTGEVWLEATKNYIYTDPADTVQCSVSDTVFLEVTPLHPLSLPDTLELAYGEEYVLDVGGAGQDLTYYWYNENTGEVVSTDQYATLVGEGNDEKELIWVEVSNNGCPNYDTIWKKDHPYCAAGVPTAFSPNGDGQNDELRVLNNGISDMEFSVFNRYGELVFETEDPGDSWNGEYNGQNQDMEVFTYFLKARCFDGKNIAKKGTITLLR